MGVGAFRNEINRFVAGIVGITGRIGRQSHARIMAGRDVIGYAGMILSVYGERIFHCAFPIYFVAGKDGQVIRRIVFERIRFAFKRPS